MGRTKPREGLLSAHVLFEELELAAGQLDLFLDLFNGLEEFHALVAFRGRG